MAALELGKHSCALVPPAHPVAIGLLLWGPGSPVSSSSSSPSLFQSQPVRVDEMFMSEKLLGELFST